MKITPRAWKVALLTMLALLGHADIAWGQELAGVPAANLNAVTGSVARKNALKDLTIDRAKGREVVRAAYAKAKAERPKDSPTPYNLNALFVLGRAAYTLRENEAGAFFLKAFVDDAKKLQSPSKLIEGYNALLLFQYEVGQFEACEKTCQEFLDLALPQSADEDGLINKAKSNVIRRMLLCQSRLGQFDKAEKVLKKISGRGGLNPLAEQDLRCRMLREAGRLDDAIAGYQKLIEMVEQDEALRKDQRDGISDELKYTLTGLYTETKEVDKAVKILEELVQKEPSNPTYNNDLGYILADNNRDLEKAEKLVRRALEEDKKRRQKAAEDADPEEKDDEETAELDNASYLDSLGWVLYRTKRYDEAQKALEGAVAVEAGRNTEIYDHLADVLAAKGDKAGAIKYYGLALETVSASKRDQMKKAQIEEKLKALR
ncbi:MAG: tetratricopeptide repeat protein [Gemmataceae bacterium]